jgi:hypothetical protein
LRKQRLGEEISKLIFGRYRQELHNTSLQFFTHNVAINVEVLGAFMKDRVGSYVKGTLIITIKDGKLGASDVQVLKKVNKPLEFTCSRGEGAILSLRRGTSIVGCFLVRQEIRD